MCIRDSLWHKPGQHFDQIHTALILHFGYILHCNGINQKKAQNGAPVSYTHLDVYKRQTKPFGVMELISRVKALLRRIDRVKKEDLNYGTIRIDVSRHTVQVDGNEVELTYKDYETVSYTHLIGIKGRKIFAHHLAAQQTLRAG